MNSSNIRLYFLLAELLFVVIGGVGFCFVFLVCFYWSMVDLQYHVFLRLTWYCKSTTLQFKKRRNWSYLILPVLPQAAFSRSKYWSLIAIICVLQHGNLWALLGLSLCKLINMPIWNYEDTQVLNCFWITVARSPLHIKTHNIVNWLLNIYWGFFPLSFEERFQDKKTMPRLYPNQLENEGEG